MQLNSLFRIHFISVDDAKIFGCTADDELSFLAYPYTWNYRWLALLCIIIFFLFYIYTNMYSRYLISRGSLIFIIRKNRIACCSFQYSPYSRFWLTFFFSLSFLLRPVDFIFYSIIDKPVCKLFVCNWTVVKTSLYELCRWKFVIMLRRFAYY
jgi:hypothetical protein